MLEKKHTHSFLSNYCLIEQVKTTLTGMFVTNNDFEIVGEVELFERLFVERWKEETDVELWWRGISWGGICWKPKGRNYDMWWMKYDISGPPWDDHCCWIGAWVAAMTKMISDGALSFLSAVTFRSSNKSGRRKSMFSSTSLIYFSDSEVIFCLRIARVRHCQILLFLVLLILSCWHSRPDAMVFSHLPLSFLILVSAIS